MILYRPTGKEEYELIKESNFCCFPSRLAQQPIFYPVCNLNYAREITKKWNKKEGYVFEFEIEDNYIKKFSPHIVGNRTHQEYWIPADQLQEFNQHIIGKIKIIEKYV